MYNYSLSQRWYCSEDDIESIFKKKKIVPNQIAYCVHKNWALNLCMSDTVARAGITLITQLKTTWLYNRVDLQIISMRATSDFVRTCDPIDRTENENS